MNTVLLIFLIWIPLDLGEGSVTAENVSADYIKQTYATEAQCAAAKQGDTQVFWSKKAGHRMIGTKQCTDGVVPATVSIGNMLVTVETVATVPASGGGT